MVGDSYVIKNNMMYVPTNQNSSFDTVQKWQNQYSAVSVVYSNGNIIYRFYSNIPKANSTTNYRDVYVSDGYRIAPQEKTQTWFANMNVDYYTITTNENYNPSMIRLTNKVYYRNDFTIILITTVVLAYILFLMPLKMIMRLFKKGAR